VHPSTSGRNRNCVSNVCQKIADYWTNIKNSFSDIFGISTNSKDGRVFMLKNYVSTAYGNTNDGLGNNITDGLKVLADKYAARCPKESIFWADPASGSEYEITCADIEKIRAVWAYNGISFDVKKNYLRDIANQLRNISGVFSGTSYTNTDELIEKLILANENRIEVKVYSPVELRVTDSGGAVEGVVNQEIKDDIYNAVYDPSAESIGIFFPQDTYRYIVAGNAEGAYSLVINSTGGATTTNFTAADIPVAPGAVHEYAIDEAALERGEVGATIRVDENGDGIFEKTITSDGELTHEEYILQTETVIDFDPDALNLKSGNGKITVHIELPLGFDASAIEMATIKLNGTAALEKPASIGDYNNNGISDLMVKFDKSAVAATLTQEKNPATATVTGKVLSNDNRLLFSGEDTIKIVGRK
ncbi:MAG: hypothetical protein AAB642_00455, partial [Patescibacteria group bacterium]